MHGHVLQYAIRLAGKNTPCGGLPVLTMIWAALEHQRANAEHIWLGACSRQLGMNSNSPMTVQCSHRSALYHDKSAITDRSSACAEVARMR